MSTLKKNANITVNLDESQWSEFVGFCREHDLGRAKVLRCLINGFLSMEKNEQIPFLKKFARSEVE